MSQNPDAVANQGEFSGHVKPSEPLMSSGVRHNPSYSTRKKFPLEQSLLQAHRPSPSPPALLLHTHSHPLFIQI